jgi:hypothetical protein
MTKQIEAMKQALDALENHVVGDSLLGGVKRASAIAVLHDALVEPAVQRHISPFDAALDAQNKAIEAQLSIETRNAMTVKQFDQQTPAKTFLQEQARLENELGRLEAAYLKEHHD